MKKIADGYYEVDSVCMISEGVVASLTIDVIDGEDLDTDVDLRGKFVIAGKTRGDFLDKLRDLVEEYRI